MGNKLTIKKYIKTANNNRKIVLDEKIEKEINDLFPQQHNNNYYPNNYAFNEQKPCLKKYELRNLLQISDKANFDTIFEIFGDKNENKEEIIYQDNLKYLYYSFTDNQSKIKFILFSFLIFGDKEYIEEKELKQLISRFFIKNVQLFAPFFNYTIKIIEIVDKNKKKGKKNHKNENELLIPRDDFIKNVKLFENANSKIISEFHFIKKYIGSNEFTFDSSNKNNNLNFYCDCSKNESKSTIEINENKFDNANNIKAMRNVYKEKTNNTNKVLYYTELRKILKEKKIEENLINLVVDYLSKNTFKEYCYFNDIKDIFNNLEFSLDLKDKKKFLFKMISTINKNENRLTYKQIAKYLNVENSGEDKKNENNNEINNNGSYDEDDFIKNDIFDGMINKMETSLDNFGLLPYLEFKVKTNDKNVRKRLINDVLNEDILADGGNYEKYLEKNFEQGIYFYAIDINLWNSLIDPKADAPDYLDNSKIAEEINIMKMEDIYKKIESERISIQLEEERKKREEKEKKIKKNKNKENQIQNQVNNEQTKTNEENKIKEIKTKSAKLKQGMKFQKDFIIVSDDLFRILKNNYKINFIIKIRKIQEIIDFNKNQKQKNEKEKDKSNKEKENTEENQSNENNEEEKQNDEELIKKENSFKEKLDKFIIDEERGFISKIVKYDSNSKNKENSKKYILSTLDFYPVRTYTNIFGSVVRIIEKLKKKYEELEKEKIFNESSDKDKRKIIEQRNKEYQSIHDKSEKFTELKNQLIIKRQRGIITDEEYKEQYKELKEQFSDIFEKKEKTQSDYEVDITMTEFKDILCQAKNDFLVDLENNIYFRPRDKTYKEMKDKIISDNYNTFKDRKYKIYYFYYTNKSLFIPDDDFQFESEGKPYEPFVCILVDIENEKGETFYNLLEKKEKEEEIKPENKIKKDQNKKQNNLENNKNKVEPKKETKKPQMTEEQKKALKEQQRLEKIEREKKEKEEKLKMKKMREEYEKQQREKEKKYAKRLKEIEQKEKEQKQRQKQLQKEREAEIQRQKEREEFISPPYGIDNYGNTCYFNSVNQIFLNLPFLQQIFLDPRINYFINKNNKFGHQGKFFEIFQALYWIKKSKIGDTVKDLKKMVGKLKEDFNNTQQQDANEYLNFLIDNLHEEINLHSSKQYIEERDEIFYKNTVEEVGNIYWANSLRRNASFIDSLFMFQLKSNLKCKKCNKVKYNFENNYMFDLPLSLCKMVTVDIYLYKLPFIYKFYFQEINQKFKQYLEQQKNKENSLIENLWNYYSDELTLEEKKDHSYILHFSFDLEREKTMIDIIKILRGIKILELEPENMEKIKDSEDIELYKVNQYTDLITYSKEKRIIIEPEQELDKFVNIEDKIIINVYEVLNSRGMKKLFEKDKKNNSDMDDMNLNSFIPPKDIPKNNDENKNKIETSGDKEKIKSTCLKKLGELNITGDKDNIHPSEILDSKGMKKTLEEKNVISYEANLYSFIPLKDKPKSIDDIKNKLKSLVGIDSIKLVSLKEKMSYLKDQEIKLDIEKNSKCKFEFVLPIYHYKVSSKNSKYFFRDFYHVKINDFPVQYIILNNNDGFTAKNLYDYIWNLNKLYMNHPNLDTKEFWWNKINKKQAEKGKFKIKSCYPFVLRYIEIKKNKDEDYYTELINCPLCPWYSFCPGCIIDPMGDLSNISSEYGIVVDWCYNFIEDELTSFNFKFSKDIDSQVISENLPIIDKNQNYQSIRDCFNLFFDEEDLEDPLFCHNCNGPENFSKKYSINRLPYILILSLKRFKFNKNSNFKLRQMITYPLYDLELEGKKYDLYGVINHYGSINSGHYTAIIKNKEKKWIMCNDSHVYEIEEKRVMHSNAYILFYISKESPYNFDYIRKMKSLMNSIVSEQNDKKNKKFMMTKDMNYFRYEPVRIDMKTKYNLGYIIEENSDNFKYDENYDIYIDLRKQDKIRIENIIKKDGDKKDGKKNENDINKKEENKNIKGVDEKDKINESKKLENKEQNNNKDSNNESQKKENNNKETNSNKIETNNLNKKEENTKKENNNEEIKKENNKENDKNEIKDKQENKEIKDENNEVIKKENNNQKNEEEKIENKENSKENENEIDINKGDNKENLGKDNLKQEKSNKNDKEIETDVKGNEEKNKINKDEKSMNDKNEIKSNEKDIKIEQNENQNIISNEENKNISKKININKEGEILPEYYKDLVRVKLEFCEGWIHKSRVEKILNLEEKEKNKK